MGRKLVYTIVFILALVGCGTDEVRFIYTETGDRGPELVEPDPGLVVWYDDARPGHPPNMDVDPGILEARMLALPGKFLQEISKPDRHPFVLVEIEGSGLYGEATTEADWENNTGEGDVDYGSSSTGELPPPPSGDVILAPDTSLGVTSDDHVGVPISDIVTTNWNIIGTGLSDHYEAVDAGYYYDESNYLQDNYSVPGQVAQNFTGGISMTLPLSEVPENAHIAWVRLIIRGRVEYGTGDIVSGTFEGILRSGGTANLDSNEGEQTISSSWYDYVATWNTNPFDGDNPWRKETLSDITGIGCYSELTITDGGGLIQLANIYLEVGWYDFEGTGNIQVDLDLGEVPEGPRGIVSFRDTEPAGTFIWYQGWGSNASSPGTGDWTPLTGSGYVVDGEHVDPYRWYRINAQLFCGNQEQTPVVHSIRVDVPNKLYRYNSLDTQFLDSLPLVEGIPNRTIKLNTRDFITEGSSMSVRLINDGLSETLLRENHLKGLPVFVKVGMYRPDISEGDLIDYFPGSITDYEVREGAVVLKVKDVSKDLSMKLPKGDRDAGTLTPIEYDSSDHMVDVILDLIERAGIADRWIDYTSFYDLKENVGDGGPTGNPGPNEFLVRRWSETGQDTRLTDPVPAKKLISEILQLLGAFLISQEDGSLVALEYDSGDSSVDDWDDYDIFEGAMFKADMDGSLRNLIEVFYDWDGEGQDATKNYGLVYIVADQDAIDDNHGKEVVKIIKSDWLSSTTGYNGTELAGFIAQREVTRLKYGQGVFTCKTSLDKIGVQVGDMVNITSDLVVSPDRYPGEPVKFFVTQKKMDIDAGTISWSMAEAR